MASTRSQHQDAAVGGVGLALGIADMVTDNKTLTKIGTYLGAAAAGGGLGALAAGAMGNATRSSSCDQMAGNKARRTNNDPRAPYPMVATSDG